MKRALVASALLGCATFEDPTIVLDLRVLAMTAQPGPEQVIALDLEHPPTPAEVLAQLGPTTVCALVADPGRSRRLRWSMTMCLPDASGRCDPSQPSREAGSGIADDPDESPSNRGVCTEIFPDHRMFEILFAAREADVLGGLGGIDFVIELRIGDEQGDATSEVVASKKLRVSPQIPRAREANHNPYLADLYGERSGSAFAFPFMRCAEASGSSPPQVLAGNTLALFPVEPDGVREDYRVPTLDGRIAELTETVTYHWLAGRGSFSDETTGGGHDVLGNQSLLGTDWRAPDLEFIGRSTLVPIWVIQRDERLGVSWFETCVEVMP